MPKIDISAEKWNRKMEKIGPVWKEGVNRAKEEGRYGKGIETFTGRPVKPLRVELWEAGVDAITPEKFAEAVRGKGDRWKARYLDAMTA